MVNNAQREQLAKLSTQLETILSELETLRDEEGDKFDNMPESLQGGEKGQAMEAARDAMDEACTHLNDTIASVEEAQQ